MSPDRHVKYLAGDLGVVRNPRTLRFQDPQGHEAKCLILQIVITPIALDQLHALPSHHPPITLDLLYGRI
jgi:hypothetical protein